MSVRVKDLPPEMRERARTLKRKAIAVERMTFATWCAAAGLPAPTPEHRFHRTRKWRFDWAWLDQRVALEVDGGVFQAGGGRHNRGAGYRADAEKINEAACLGWRVLRVLPEQLYDARTIDWLRRAILP